jgi:SEC-C motif-containing protein
VSVAGRNDPCPCGSGRKFKRCCLSKSGAAPQFYSSAERNNALAKLMRFAARPKYKELHRAALALFWGDWLSEKPDHQLEEVMTSEQVEIAYNSWLAFDFDRGGGRRMLDDYLETEGNKLSSGELNYLNGLRGSHLRLYEILEVKPDQGFEVRDLWDDRRLYVRERAATRQIVVWDLVVARIGPGGDGETVFETIPYLFRAADKDDLLKGLRKAHQAFLHEFPDKGIADFFRTMAPVFHKLWLERVALPPHPKLITGDGEPFIFAKVLFDLADRDAVIRSLADRDDIVDQDDGSYVWLEPAGDLQRSVGTIIIEERRVVLETTSQKRAEKARDELANLFGGAARFRAISYEDVEQALKRAPQTNEPKEPDIPIEEQRKILGEYYENHYRKWLDEPVPALGNRTPRHAARLKTVRPKLVALLKDFESHSERQRRAGEIAYDFSWMWDELELNRE